jgi:SAM-dependent methyltransferase
VINQAGTHAMLDCCSHIKADSYDPDLESDLLKLYEIPELNHAQLSQVTSSILVHKYDLENEECILDVDTLASDELLISLLNKGELCDSRIEEVVTLLRQQILIEVAQTVSLRDELQELAIGLGRFIERTDFVPQASNDETIIVEDIDECIRGAFQSHVNTDDLAGALIVVSMYKQLYTQNYSYHLLNYDLTDWPAAIQPLLSANLYKKSDLHAIKFGLPHGNQNIDRSFNSPYLAAAYPRWEVLPYHTSANYYEALRSELGNEAVPEYWANKDINVLVIGCRTGDRAIRIARYFEGTKVTAIDLSADNIAYAIYQAKLHGVNNIDFHVINESKELQNIGEHFDVIEIADELSADLEVILHSKNMLAEDGLIRFEIAQDNHLINNAVTEKLREKSYLPTAENVRQLRSEIIQMEKENKEVSVSKNKAFYSLTGCYQLLFQTYDNSKATMRTVWDKTGLRALNNLSADHTVYTKVSGLTSHLRQA